MVAVTVMARTPLLAQEVTDAKASIARKWKGITRAVASSICLPFVIITGWGNATSADPDTLHPALLLSAAASTDALCRGQHRAEWWGSCLVLAVCSPTSPHPQEASPKPTL